MKIISNAKSLLVRLHSDSLYRNSIYLMASTFVMSFFGFFFWMINTRLYTPEQIGLATTLISVTSLITSFSMLGFTTALIRFLPSQKNKNDLINTAFTIISLTAIIITVVFFIGLPVFSPRLMFVRNDPVFILSFAVYMVVASLNTVTDSVFIAFRNTRYTFIINTITSFVKLISPVFLVALGAFGIFYSVMISVNLAMLLSLVFIATFFKIYFVPVIKTEVIKKIWRYSFGNYLAGFFGMAPGLILPLIVINNLGPKATAYYYMPSMIISLLLAIPRATTSSLFAEGAHREENLKVQIIKSFKIIGLILLPATILLMVFGKYILLVFGKEYSFEGFVYLQLTAISILVSIPNYIMGTILNVKRQVRKILFLSITGCIISLSLSFLFISRGLTGLGLASILTQLILVLINFLIYRGLKK